MIFVFVCDFINKTIARLVVYVTNDVVDLLPTAMVIKENDFHDFLPIFSMVCICLYVSCSISELM